MCNKLKCAVNYSITAYSEFEDDYLEKKGDEWLPLGKSFQRHAELFVK